MKPKCQNCINWLNFQKAGKGFCNFWEWFYGPDFCCSKFKDLKYKNQMELFKLGGQMRDKHKCHNYQPACEQKDCTACDDWWYNEADTGRREPLAVEVYNLAYVFGITMYDFGRLK